MGLMGLCLRAWWLGVVLAASVAGADSWHKSQVIYEEPKIEATYVAHNYFDMRAMGSLYNSSKYIIDFIVNKQAYPEGFIAISDGFVEVASPSEKWRPLLAHYAGPLAVLVVALLLAALLPLAGFIWCCCVWCSSGRRRRPFDRKYDACIKGILAIVLIALLTLFLFGVVCAFATEQQLEAGGAGAGAGLGRAARDVTTYLNATQAHLDHLLVHDFQTMRRHVEQEIDGGGALIAQQLEQEAGLGALRRLAALVEQLPALKADLDTLNSVTALLRYNADRLNSGLRKVKGNLLQTLANCEQPQCRRLQEKYRISQLDTEIHYSQVPDVTPLLSNLSALAGSGVQRELAQAQAQLSALPRRAAAALRTRKPQAQRALQDAEDELKRLSEEIGAQAEAGRQLAAQALAPAGEQLERVHREHGHWRRALGLATACAALLITSLLALGVSCGTCGSRPDTYGASDCCNKGAGATALMCGTGVIFLAGGCMALVLAVYFAVGVAAQRGLCDPLTEPEGNRLFGDIEKLVDLEKVMFQQHEDPAYNMQAVMRRCHQNYTLYVTLGLQRKYNLTELRARLQQQVAAAVAGVGGGGEGEARVTLLPAQARDKLRRLAASGLADFQYDAILDALSTNITSLPLGALAAQLAAAGAELAPRGGFTRVAAELRAAGDLLAALHQDTVLPLQQELAELNATAHDIRSRLGLGAGSLQDTVAALLQQTDDAERYLNTQGQQRLNNLTQEFAASVGEAMEEYLDHVNRSVMEDVGRCGPMSHAYNATRDTFCVNILLPIHGYWIALSWMALLFAPLLAVSRRLAAMYRRREPYPGPLVEAEYLYDAYADRDNVPLANSSKRSTLDIEGKIAEWRSRGAVPPSAPPDVPDGGSGGGAGGAGSPPGSATRLLLAPGGDVTCELLPPPPPAALIEDLKTRLDAKDEDNESGIHESDAYKAEKRSRRGGGGGVGAGVASGSGGGGASPAPPADHHHARRYNDMAPKHWEEGPPRYLGPTEYERPPPYYYPPPNDRE